MFWKAGCSFWKPEVFMKLKKKYVAFMKKYEFFPTVTFFFGRKTMIRIWVHYSD